MYVQPFGWSNLTSLGSMGFNLIIKTILQVYLTIQGIQFDCIIRLCENDFNSHNLCTSQQLHMGVQFDFIRYVNVILISKTLLQVSNSILGSSLTSLGFVGVILVFKTFLQVSFTSIWASNLASLGYVGMILIFKGL